MRQLVLEKMPQKDGLLVLDEGDFRHLRQVLRVKSGDMIDVRLADGRLCGATVAKIDDRAKKITLQLYAGSAENEAVPGKTEWWLFQFVPRPQKFELIVRQATECGVAVIVPVIGEFSEKSGIQALRSAKKERLERIIKEARQQSGSAVQTRVTEPMGLADAIVLWNDVRGKKQGFVLYERTDGCVPLQTVVKSAGLCDNVCVVTGCEGGISPAELAILREDGGFLPIHFATNVLRCETAALYGIAAIQTCCSLQA